MHPVRKLFERNLERRGQVLLETTVSIPDVMTLICAFVTGRYFGEIAERANLSVTVVLKIRQLINVINNVQRKPTSSRWVTTQQYNDCNATSDQCPHLETLPQEL
jgi:hypothetical protein